MVSGPRHPAVGQGRPAADTPESAFLAVVSAFARRLISATNSAVGRRELEAAADSLTNTFPDRLPQTAPMLWGDLLFGFREGRPTLFSALELAQMVIALLSLAVSPPPGDHAQDEGRATVYVQVPVAAGDAAQDEIAASVVIASGTIGGNGDHAQDQVAAGVVLQIAAVAGDHAQDQVAAGVVLQIVAVAGDHAQDQTAAVVALQVAAANGDHAQDQVAAAVVLQIAAVAGDHAQDQGAGTVAVHVPAAAGDHAQDQVAASVTIVPSGSSYTLDALSSGAQSAVAVALSVARRLTSSYSGNLVRLRRSSDDAESDFGFDGSGDLDVAAIASWATGTDAFIVTIYDQSGNANDCDQATAARQMQLVDAGSVLTSNGIPAATNAGTDGAGRNELGVLTSAVNLGASDWAFWFVLGREQATQPLLRASSSGHTYVRWISQWTGSENNYTLTVDDSDDGNVSDSPTFMNASPGAAGDGTVEPKCVIVNYDVGTENTSYVNSTTAHGSNTETDGADKAYDLIGHDFGFLTASGQYCEFILFDGQMLDSTDRTALMTDGTTYYT